MKKLLCILGAVMLAASTAHAAELNSRDLTSIAMGSERQAIHQKIGSPASVSGNGAKETYKVLRAKAAVLQYDKDTLSRGFILY